MLTRRRLAGVLLAVLVASLLTPARAHAAPPRCQEYNSYGICLIWATSPGRGGADRGGGSGGSGGGGGGRRGNITVSGVQCFPIGLVNPQPPRSEPVWKGHTDGSIYGCEVAPQVLRGSVVAGYVIRYWATSAPPPPPDPRVLAQQAIASMRLKAITIGIVPEPGPGSVGIIGMPTWLWAENPTPSTWGPIARSASAGGYSVAATAKVDRVMWSMGDGSTVTCATPGTPYADSFGKKSSPDCGHTYTRQGTYVVAATSYWSVAWAGIGQSGTIPIDFTQQATIVMGESQVLNN